MNVEQALKTVTGRLQSGNLDNEAQVKQAVILPVLRALSWDDTDPKIFRPEYGVPGGSVDYALIYHDKPLVFIEAKRVGNLNAGGVEQVLRYASNQGVPFLVLTDGNRWDFYLSMAEGIPTERRFYRLELLLEHKIPEYTSFLKDHLEWERVISGQARISAEKRHASNRERSRAQRAIPGVWKTLLKGPDETLRDLLAETVESECGTKPELDDIETFLQGLSLPSSPPVPDPRPPPPSPKLEPKPPRPQPIRLRIVGFVFRDQREETGSARGALTALLTRLDREDPAFMEQFSVASTTRSRRLIAKNRADLYDKSHLADEHSLQLPNGWWLGTNLSQKQIRSHIKTACSVAGIGFGSELTLVER